MRLRGIIVATLVFAAPALFAWLLARTVSQGLPSELGLWAGLGLGLLSGGGLWVGIQSLGSVRVLTAAAEFVASVIVSYVVLVGFAAVLRTAQNLGRFSSDTLAAMLSCAAAGAFWAIRPVLIDGRPAGWLYLAAALAFPPVLIGMMSRAHSRESARRSDEAPRLLLLRTFGHAQRSNRLLRLLAGVWLELGSIDLVAGPDLASSVVTLDKVYAWLTGRLRTLFIADSADFARVLGSGTRRLRDGRYPVHEFSCLDSGWRETVIALARDADAIIMDLRSFTRQNSGCVFEIRTLIATVLPNRIEFLVDESTDLPALEEVFQHASRELGAPAGWAGTVTKVYRLDGDSRASIKGIVAAVLGTLQQRDLRLVAPEQL
jgi:hypothetical protein